MKDGFQGMVAITTEMSLCTMCNSRIALAFVWLMNQRQILCWPRVEKVGNGNKSNGDDG